MNVPPEPGLQMDHRFFVTGLVMLLGTLMSGAITLSITNSMVEKETNIDFAGSRVGDQTAFDPALDIKLQ